MPLAPVIAASLSAGLPSRSLALWVGGVDMIREPGAPDGTRYGTDIDSIEVIEAGLNGVSTMTFVVHDPSNELVVNLGDPVLFQDLDLNLPLFAGFVSWWEYRVVGISRDLEIRAVGIEAVLDWVSIPSLTIPAGTTWETAAVSLLGQALGCGAVVRAALSADTSSRYTGGVANLSGGFTTGYAIVLANASIRDALQEIGASLPINYPPTSLLGDATIDAWGNLRAPLLAVGGGGIGGEGYAFYGWGEYSQLVTVNATGSASPAADEASLGQDGSNIVRAVYVVGGNAAGSGLVPDGTGIPGPIAIVSNNDSTSEDLKRQVAAEYFGVRNRSGWARGSFRWVEYTNPSTLGASSWRHAGGTVQVTDSILGLAAATNIGPSTRIRKRYRSSGVEEWEIFYGDQPPSMARETRRLTRTTRS